MKISSMKDVPVGSVLELRNGKTYLYIGVADKYLESSFNLREGEKYLGLSKKGFMAFKEDFTTANSDWNIEKIYEPRLTYGTEYEKTNVIYEVSKEMTLEDIERKLGHKIILKEK